MYMHMYVQIFVTWYACTLKIMYIMNYVHTLNFFQNLWTNFNLKHKAYLIYSYHLLLVIPVFE